MRRANGWFVSLRLKKESEYKFFMVESEEKYTWMDFSEMTETAHVKDY